MDNGDIKFETHIITPQKAQAWLETQVDNRRLNPDKVREYANEIKAGRWRYTHQPIAFDTEGQLLDGQHRMAAIKLAGISIKLAVAFGVKRGEFTVIDRGMPRNMSTITGIPKFFTECYVLMLSMAGALGRPSPDDVYLLNQYLSDKVNALQDACNTAIRFYSSAPIRTAAIISMEAGEDSSYVLNTYKGLVLQNPESIRALPTIALALIQFHNRQANGLSKSAGNTGHLWRVETYSKARFLFSRANASLNQIHIRQDLMTRYISEVTNIVRKILEASPGQDKISLLLQLRERDRKQIQTLQHKLNIKTASSIEEEQIRLSKEARD